MRLRTLFFLAVILPVLAGPAVADEAVVEWRSFGSPSPQPRSLPPVCMICLHGEVGFDLLAFNTQVNLRTRYIVNYNDYGVPEGRSGTLVLGFFLFPGEFENLQADDINPYNHANLFLSSLGGNEAFFADVDEVGPIFRNVPSGGQYFAYLLLGEVVEVRSNGSFQIELRDFAVMHPFEQPDCAGTTCLLAAPGGAGGNSGGVGQGGGSEGGGDQENINKDEEPREPTERAECGNTTRNRANADTATVASEVAALIRVLDNDIINPEGTLALSIDAAPGNGSAEVIGSAIRYTANPGFTGSDFFTYRIGSVCGLATLPARVDVEVTAAPPPVFNCPLEVKLPEELAVRTEATSLLNISTRGLVGDCGDTLRAGFINADSEATYFIRGRGPTLGGVNPLANPRIRLLRFEDGVELASNDDWPEHATSECLVAGGQLEPRDDREAALLITLGPGAYLAILESADATGSCDTVYGNGIIEVNDVRLFPDEIQP